MNEIGSAPLFVKELLLQRDQQQLRTELGGANQEVRRRSDAELGAKKRFDDVAEALRRRSHEGSDPKVRHSESAALLQMLGEKRHGVQQASAALGLAKERAGALIGKLRAAQAKGSKIADLISNLKKSKRARLEERDQEEMCEVRSLRTHLAGIVEDRRASERASALDSQAGLTPVIDTLGELPRSDLSFQLPPEAGASGQLVFLGSSFENTGSLQATPPSSTDSGSGSGARNPREQDSSPSNRDNETASGHWSGAVKLESLGENFSGGVALEYEKAGHHFEIEIRRAAPGEVSVEIVPQRRSDALLLRTITTEIRSSLENKGLRLSALAVRGASVMVQGKEVRL